MQLTLLFLLIFSAPSFAVKGTYTDKSVGQACKINYKVPCPKDNSKTCTGTCSGTYLGGKSLLTADHCLKSFGKMKRGTVICPNGEERTITKALTSRGAGFEVSQDVGLFTLDREFSMKGMALVNGEDEQNELLKDKESCYLAGYGLDNNGKHGGLKVSQIDKVESEGVMRTFGWRSSGVSEQFKMSGNYADHGDSGGTFFCEKDGNKILMGVMQGGTKGMAYSFTEKLTQVSPWIQFQMGAFGATGNDYYRKMTGVHSWCDSVSDCIHDLQEISKLGENVSAIVSKVIDQSSLLDKQVNLENFSELDLFKRHVDDLVESWREVYLLCDDYKDALVDKHNIPNMY